MMKYNQSPLPFQGQKRRFLRQFRQALKQVRPGAVFVDLFGGSGLLAHTVKQERPEARVIYNDYDDFAQRLEGIPATNRLLAAIRELVREVPDNARVPEAVKAKILGRIKREKGFVDYQTLSANLLFSGKFVNDYAGLEKEAFYGKVRLADYAADGYLEGVERVRADYRALFEQHAAPDVVFLIDPPYLSTDCTSYANYWKLGDYLDVLTTLQLGNYFYFTSNKSQVVELCAWMATHSNYSNPFANAAISTTANSINYNSGYTDIMVYKLNGNE